MAAAEEYAEITNCIGEGPLKPLVGWDTVTDTCAAAKALLAITIPPRNIVRTKLATGHPQLSFAEFRAGITANSVSRSLMVDLF